MKFLAFILLFVSITANAGTDYCKYAKYSKSSIESTIEEIKRLENAIIQYEKQLEEFPALIASQHRENNLAIKEHGKSAYVRPTSEHHFELVKNLYKEAPIKLEKLKNDLVSNEQWFKENTQKCEEFNIKEELRKKKPGASIGMTKKQVINDTSWGEPHHVNTTMYGKHVQEQWVYEDGTYLYFYNGILRAAQY